MDSGGASDLAGGDRGDPIGPGERLVQSQAKTLEFEEPFGALLDGLELEDPRSGHIAAGTLDLVVGEGAGVHGTDLFDDRGDDTVGLVGRCTDVDAEQPRHQVGRFGDPAADGVGQPHLVTYDPAEAIVEARPAAEDVVEHGQGGEVGVVPHDAQMPEHDVDLLSGMRHAADPRPCQADRAG